jgi:hypothetical protein
MIHGQNDQFVVLVAPATVTVATNATSYGYLDCLGYDQARFVYTCTLGTATGVAAKQFAIREGTNSTAATAIVALTGGTATATSVAFVCGALDTKVPVAMVLDVDCTKRERYLRVQVTPGEKNVPCVIGILSRGKVMPGTDDPALSTLTWVVNHVIA